MTEAYLIGPDSLAFSAHLPEGHGKVISAADKLIFRLLEFHHRHAFQRPHLAEASLTLA